MLLQVKKSSDKKYNGATLDNKIGSIDLEKREENDGDDNLESHEEAADLESSIDEISRHMTTNITVNDGGPSIKSDGRPHESGAQLDLQNSISSEVCDSGLQWLSVTFIFFQYWFGNLV